MAHPSAPLKLIDRARLLLLLLLIPPPAAPAVAPVPVPEPLLLFTLICRPALLSPPLPPSPPRALKGPSAAPLADNAGVPTVGEGTIKPMGRLGVGFTGRVMSTSATPPRLLSASVLGEVVVLELRFSPVTNALPACSLLSSEIRAWSSFCSAAYTS